ncbi:MAG: phosphopantothenoylcysteine decarboxylase [Planctomycetota bacterium]
MNVLVTAGNTQTLIDKVRCITNIFTGRTGASLALEAWRRGHRVRLVTSHPEVVVDLARGLKNFPDERWSVSKYQTFDDLHVLLEASLRHDGLDAVLHTAAVSDYRAAGIFAPDSAATFDERTGAVQGRFIDRAAGKIKSDEPELWLRLTRTPKLVDLFREPWGFRGLVVKFKLEVDKTMPELIAIGEHSRRQSHADFMVINTLEEAADWALLGPLDGQYPLVPRGDLARRVIDVVEQSFDR